MATDLKAPCPHGRYDEHTDGHSWFEGTPHVNYCPGGTLLPPGSLVIVKEDGEWPDDVLAYVMEEVLDALAAAQPGQEMAVSNQRHRLGNCPGGSLLPPDSLVIVKENGSWPAWPLAWISDLLGGTPNMREDLEPFLDALAAAQPGRET